MLEQIQESKSVVYIGRGLAYKLRGKSPAERAAIAASYDRSAVSIICPTDKQLAAVFRISNAGLRAARVLPVEDRQEVLRGRKPLNGQQSLDHIVRKHGVAPVWDALCRVIDHQDNK